MLFQKRARARAAGLVHIAFNNTAALNAHVFGVLAADLDHRQVGAAVHVATGGGGCVGDDLVQHHDVLVEGEHGAQQGRNCLAP